MLKIIQGGFHSEAKEAVRAEILRRTERGESTLLIVPEQQTVLTETEMTALLPPSAPLTFEVTNFTRLSNSVFRTLGGIGKQYCDKTHRALIMWRTLTELSPVLNMTGGRRDISAGAVDRALRAVAEMQSRGVNAEALAEAEPLVPKDEGRLGSKIADLSRIMTLYKKLLTEKYADSGDDAEELCRKVEEHPEYFKGSAFFFEGFTSFTEPQYRLIALLGRTAEVTVSLAIPKAAEDSFEYTEVRSTARRLAKMADKSGAEKKLIRLDGRSQAGSMALSECCDLLWRGGRGAKPSYSPLGEELRVFEALSPYEECDFIASDIRRRVALGERYRDFAIIARRAEDYIGIIDTSLTAARIPHFISKARDLGSFEAIKLIYTAYAAISSGFGREEVIAYAKCGLSGISREACDDFELYTHKWQISGRRFTDGELWNMNPAGYTARQTPDAGELLIKINETRAALITPLTELSEAVKAADTVIEHAEALVNFLRAVGLEEKLRERAEELMLIGEQAAAEENSRLWKIICDSLDVLVEVSSEEPCNADGFLSQLKTVFASVEVGRIPAFYDEVVIGSADMIRLNGKKHIYLMGVNRGEFPMAVSEHSYFTDRDKHTLAAIGLAVEPDTDEARARELYCFSRAFSYAEKSVTLLFTDTNAQFSKTQHAEVIDRLAELYGDAAAPVRIADLNRASLLYTPEQALTSLGELSEEDYPAVREALIESGAAGGVEVAERRIENDRLMLNKEATALLYSKNELALTQSRIDSYTDCPLAYFCRYNLSLSEGEAAEFDARSIGSFIHAVLESFFGELKRTKRKPNELTADDKRELVKRGAEEYLELIGRSTALPSRRTELLLDRLCRTALPVVDGLCDEFSDCGYIPRYFELKIEKNAESSPEPARFSTPDGREVFVYGSIDRVDTYEANGNVYVRVVDYKTGHKDFSPEDIDKGKNLQMFLYLKSVVDTKNSGFLKEIGLAEGGRLIPAGVIYVKTEIGDVRIEKDDEDLAKEKLKAAQGRQGMLLNDPTSLSAMNAKYIPVKFKKDGAPDARSENKLYSEEGWQSLCDRMGEVIGNISKRMTSGDICASPMLKKGGQVPCEYCKFKPVCRNVRTK